MLDDLVQVQFLLVCLFRLSAYRLVSVSALHPFSLFVFLLGRRPVRRFFVVQSVRSCVYLPGPLAHPPMRLSVSSLPGQSVFHRLPALFPTRLIVQIAFILA